MSTYGASVQPGGTIAAADPTKLSSAGGYGRKQMAPLIVILTGLTGTLASVVAYFWPQLMTWTREHLLPWVDKYVPDLARAVRLAFHDLDEIGVGWRRVVRTAWQNLRNVLISQSATFVQAPNGEWVVQITSSLRNLAEADKPALTIATEQRLIWEQLPDEVQAHALEDGLDGTCIDILHARDLLLADVL
jgi:hypothetical protein